MMLRTPAAKRSRLSASPLELDDRDGEVDGGVEDQDGSGLELLGQDGYDSMRCSYKCRNMVKSELLETLDRRDKQVAELEALTESLRNKLERTEIENQRLSSKVKYLDQSVAAALTQEKSLRLQRTEEIEQAEDRFRKQLLRCNEIQAKLLQEIRIKTEAEASARAAEAEVLALKDELKSKSRDIQRLEVEVQRLHSDSELSQVDRENVTLSELFSQGTSSRRSDMSHEFERRLREADVEESKQLYPLINELQGKLRETSEEKLRLEQKVALLESKVLTSNETKGQESDIVIKNLREELNFQSAEIAEAKKLKDNHSKLELLKEQLNFEKSRAERAEAQLAAQVDMEVQVSTLEAALKEWEMLINIPGISSRDDIPEKLATMQRELSMALSANMELSSKIADLQSRLEKANSERQESVAAAVAAREKAALALEKASPLELQVSRMGREIDYLKSVLASYDEEEAIITKHQKSASVETALATPEKSKQKRIEELENCLRNLNNELEVREKHLSECIEVATEERKKAEHLAENLAKAEAKIALVERDASQLRQEVSLLEHKVARGEFDPSKTRVLRLRTNLEVQAAAQTAAKITETCEPREECELILENRQKIKTLNETVGSLKQEISTLKKRENRYMQVFAEKASTFRKACGLIFGYEIRMDETPDSSVTVFKLNSVYSRDKDYEIIEFRYTPDSHTVGRIDMVANDYTTSSEIERQVATFLQGFRSIPAFMANLTLELFNKVTIG